MTPRQERQRVLADRVVVASQHDAGYAAHAFQQLTTYTGGTYASEDAIAVLADECHTLGASFLDVWRVLQVGGGR